MGRIGIITQGEKNGGKIIGFRCNDFPNLTGNVAKETWAIDMRKTNSL